MDRRGECILLYNVKYTVEKTCVVLLMRTDEQAEKKHLVKRSGVLRQPQTMSFCRTVHVCRREDVGGAASVYMTLSVFHPST